jgi:hypothetical protein
MYELFYLLHDRFDSEAKNWIAWKVNPVLVRSIECWCNSIHQLEPIDREFITNRVKIQAHFDCWYVEGQSQHGLDRSSLIDLLAQHLLAKLQRHPEDPIVQQHWIAFLMHRCVTVGWRIWRFNPQQTRSFGLFEDIVVYGYSKIANPDKFITNFKPGTSQLVSGLNHLKAFIDGRIRYSIFPYLRQESGDPNFGRSNLGVAARHSRSEIIKALQCLHPADRVNDEIILWQCLVLYRGETGIHVNRLVETDFEQIGQLYHQRIECSAHVTGAEIKQRLEVIGSAVRKYKLRQPLSMDASILTKGKNNTGAISLGETNLINDGDLLAAQESQEIRYIVSRELKNLFNEQPLNNKVSYQQLFWLYYGLKLNQQEIGQIIKHNFRLTSNPGNISRRLRQAYQDLFQRIHSAIQNEPPQLTDKEIDAAMSTVLEMYFETAIPSLLGELPHQLNVLLQKPELIQAIETWIETKIHLQLQFDFVQTAIEHIIDDFLDRS